MLGWGLGAYAFTMFKSARRKPARLVLPAGTDAALATVEATRLARDLINTPAADLGPAELAEAARSLAARERALARQGCANTDLQGQAIDTQARLDEQATALLQKAAAKMVADKAKKVADEAYTKAVAKANKEADEAYVMAERNANKLVTDAEARGDKAIQDANTKGDQQINKIK